MTLLSLRRSRAVSKAPGRRALVSLGLVIVAVIGGALYLSWNAPNHIPLRSYYTLHVDFTDADQLSAHYEVKIAGRLVGQVLHPRVVHGRAIADLQLTPSIRPLRSDTTLQVRPRSVVGITFVELRPGTHGRPLPNGGWIRGSQTSASVPLDQVLDTLDAPHRADAQSMLRALGEGFLGRGTDLNSDVARGPSLLADAASAFGASNAVPGAWQQLVTNTEGAASAAQPVRDAIRTGFAPEAHDMRVFAEHAAALRSLLGTAPAALPGIRQGLARSDGLVKELGALARAATATLQRAPQAFAQTTAMLRTGGPSLTAADQTIRLAAQAVDPTLSLLTTLDPVIPNLHIALSAGLPILDVLNPRGCDINAWTTNWRGIVDHGTASESGPLGPYNVLRLDEIGSASSLAALPQPAATKPTSDPYPTPCQGAQDH
jgi:ABC-type transporter Mla subunit MlaD